MNITLFKNLSPSNKVGKTLEQIGETVPVKFLTTETVNTIRVDVRQFENWNECNYIYVDEFNRYYFVDNIEHDNHPLLTLNCSVDVLESFEEQIRSSTQLVTRSQNRCNVYYVDGNINLIGKQIVQCKKFEGNQIGSDKIANTSCSIVVTVVQE